MIYRTNLVPHRTRQPVDATATVTFVRGDDDIERWRSDPDVVEVAHVDPRTSGELARYQDLAAEVEAGLRDARLDDVADLLDESVVLAGLDEQFPSELQPRILEMLALGESAAVFIGPPDLVAILIDS